MTDAAHTEHAQASSVWGSKLTLEDRQELHAEDLDAAEHTLAVLLSIVTFGVLLGIVGVLLCLRFT